MLAMKDLAALPGAAVIIQVAVSFVLIMGLYHLARAMRLGGDVRIRDEAHARALADAAISGFVAQDVALDRARIGALLRDESGRIMVVRRHGSHFAARLLSDHGGVRLDRQFLTLSAAEPRFGTITFELGAEAQAWAASLRRLGEQT